MHFLLEKGEFPAAPMCTGGYIGPTQNWKQKKYANVLSAGGIGGKSMVFFAGKWHPTGGISNITS